MLSLLGAALGVFDHSAGTVDHSVSAVDREWRKHEAAWEQLQPRFAQVTALRQGDESSSSVDEWWRHRLAGGEAFFTRYDAQGHPREEPLQAPAAAQCSTAGQRRAAVPLPLGVEKLLPGLLPGVRPPAPVQRGGTPAQAPIFVGISSYRDGARCGATVAEAFAKARRPERVVVGVVDQLIPGDVSCVDAYCEIMAARHDLDECPFRDHIRTLTQAAHKARGPSAARHGQQSLIQPAHDEWCLQIDAHAKLAPEWDLRAIAMWRQAGNERAILTHYPPGLAAYGEGAFESPLHAPQSCTWGWGERDERFMPRTTGQPHCAWLKEPKLGVAWSAGMSFSKCHAETRVRADPRLHYAFDGEEAARGARLWTHGYDFYAPPRPLVFHDYRANAQAWGHEYTVGFGSAQRKAEEEGAARLRALFDLPGSGAAAALLCAEGFGLGSARSLEQWVAFTGVDVAEHRFEAGVAAGARCAGLNWVPWLAQVPPSIALRRRRTAWRASRDSVGEAAAAEAVARASLGDSVPEDDGVGAATQPGGDLARHRHRKASQEKGPALSSSDGKLLAHLLRVAERQERRQERTRLVVADDDAHRWLGPVIDRETLARQQTSNEEVSVGLVGLVIGVGLVIKGGARAGKQLQEEVHLRQLKRGN